MVFSCGGDLSELTDWVISNGGHSKVKVEDNAKVGRHLVLTEDVLDQTAIVSVPADLVFTLRNAPKKLTEILDSIPEDVLDRSEASDLLLYLLYERFRKDTRWKPFLATQPAGFSSPILDDRCDRFLQGTPLLPVCQSLRHEMSETFEKLQKYLLERWPAEFPKDQFDRETLKWAQAICESRSFKVLVEDVEETVLVRNRKRSFVNLKTNLIIVFLTTLSFCSSRPVSRGSEGSTGGYGQP
mmetsp:Transcript_31132/g.119800  ORF Transcript_31132/g.119800 Transcript_31132/m.119800 type:complete len:241 (+) Transcript_31132:255-977(+)